MKITSRILAVAAVSGAVLAATAPAHADTDVLNLVNAKRVPVSVLSEGNTSADNIQITNVDQTGTGSDGFDGFGEHHGGSAPLLEGILHPNTIYDGQNNGFVMETVERNLN
ncbi:hypothetical protein PV721_06320 [Streptomyces sp. MB09-01]|uniref:hypothetical protein n=1 Tax=Streptomyces sp. MB09-01 TaxID=3028666 RepID=UPI0029A8EF4F|nr:hypothetical protein [Streptomyces sp. MB09-01]MDX3533986.1 hypothetical protein [Streptomyces sp. MB09-01]